MESLDITICAMSTMASDQQRVRDLAMAYPTKVIPCFGHHPWFSHLISTQAALSKDDHYRSLFLGTSPAKPEHVQAYQRLLNSLPEPTPLSDVLMKLRRNFEDLHQAMLGEVGLDRSFRVPFDYFASPRQLTPFVIPLDHQLAILEAQLDLAVELGRNVSFHSVRSQLCTAELLQKMQQKYHDGWSRINVDIHSCGLSPETWRDIEKKHRNVFLSLSTVINGRSSNHKALIAICSPDRILVESDFNDVDKCSERTWDMIQSIAAVKGWHIEEEWMDNLEETDWGAVRKLEENWCAFRRSRTALTEVLLQ